MEMTKNYNFTINSIQKYKIYTLDKVYSSIDKIVTKSEMTKIDKFHYISTNADPLFCGVFIYCHLQHKTSLCKM